MTSLEQMRGMLHEKHRLFLQYEEETAEMASEECLEPEQFEAAVAARQALIDQIDRIDRRLEAVREESEAGAFLYEITKNRCDYGKLTESEQRVFADGQELYAVITRIRELEARAVEKMETIRQELQNNIRKNNTGTKFTGYLKQMDQSNTGMLYNKKR